MDVYGHITLSIAVRADWLHLLDHPRGQLSYHDSHTSSSACHTLLHCSCFTPLTKRQTVKHQQCWLELLSNKTIEIIYYFQGFETIDQYAGFFFNDLNQTFKANSPITGTTEDILTELQFSGFTIVEVFKRNSVWQKSNGICATALFIQTAYWSIQTALKSSYLLQRMYHVISSPLASIPSSALSPHEPKQTSAKNVREDIVHARPSTSSLP